jgi:hypothetical protein
LTVPESGSPAAGQDVQQRRLPRPVGTDDADAVPAQDDIAEILDVVVPVIAGAHVLQFQDRPAQAGCRRRDFQFAVHHFFLRRRFDCLEPFHAVLFLRPPGFSAAADPGQFLAVDVLQFALRRRFLLPPFGTQLQEALIIGLIQIRPAAVQFQRAVYDTVEEIPVVRDHEEGSLALGQLAFEPGHGDTVHMVRRFVQDQQVRRTHEDAGQGHAFTLPHRQLAHRPVHIRNAQPCQDGPGFTFQLPGKITVHFLLDLHEAALGPRHLPDGLPCRPGPCDTAAATSS